MNLSIRFIALLLFFYFHVNSLLGQHNVTYHLDYEVNNVSCNGGSDGSINITSFNCIDSNSVGGCYNNASLVIPNYCAEAFDQEIDAFSNQTVTLNNGTNSVVRNNFDGYVNFHGGTLVICGYANIDYINLNAPSKIVVIGELTTLGINCNGYDVIIENYGVIDNNGYSNFQGQIVNYGNLNLKQGFNANTTTYIDNYADLIVSGGDLYLNQSSKLYNHNNVIISNNLTLNSGCELYNYCTISGVNDMTINSGAIFSNYSSFQMNSWLNLNSASNVICNPGSSFQCYGLNLSSSTIYNPDAQECALFKVTGYVNIQNVSTFSGNLSFCVPDQNQINQSAINFVNGAALNCNCVPVTLSNVNNSTPSTSYSISWDKVADSTFEIGNLTAQYYTATISNEHCSEDLTFSITEPSELGFNYIADSASCIESSDGGLKIIPFGGKSPYTVSISGVDTSVLQNISSGEYIVVVTDKNGCTIQEIIEIPIAVPPVFNFEYDTTICWGQVNTENPTYVLVSVDGVENNIDVPSGNCSASIQNEIYQVDEYEIIDPNISYYEIGAGRRVVLNQSTDATIKLNGGTLIIDQVVNIDNLILENEGDTIVVLGELNTKSINFNRTDVVLINYGTINFNNASFSIGGIFINYGQVTVPYDLNINSFASLYNYNEIIVGYNLNDNSLLYNEGIINIQKNLHVNSNAIVTNYCEITILEDALLNSDATIENYKSFVVFKNITFNSNTTFKPYPGSIFSANKGIINDVGVIFQNTGNSCSKMTFQSELLVNNHLLIDGEISLCAEGSNTNMQNIEYVNGADLSCVCEPVLGQESIFTWGNGTNSDTLYIVEDGMYYVTMEYENCSYIDSILIEFPERPQTLVEKGDVVCEHILNTGYIYLSYIDSFITEDIIWEKDNEILNVTSDSLKNLLAGTYVYTITDAKGCSISDSVEIQNIWNDCSDLDSSIIQDIFEYEIIYIDSDPDSIGPGTGSAIINVKPVDSVDIVSITITDCCTGEVYNTTMAIVDRGCCAIVDIIYEINDTIIAHIDTVIYTDPSVPMIIPVVDVIDTYENLETGQIIISIFPDTVYADIYIDGTISGNETGGLSEGEHTVLIIGDDNTIILDTTIYIGVIPYEPGDTCSTLFANFIPRNIKCYGGNTGGIALRETNATIQNIIWYKSQMIYNTSVDEISNLTKGKYRIEYDLIVDTIVCHSQDSFVIWEPTKLTADLLITKPDFVDSENGVIYIVPQGGTPNYQIESINDQSQVNNPFYYSGLSVGIYEFEVYDANNCLLDTIVSLPPIDTIVDTSASKCSMISASFDMQFTECNNHVQVIPEYSVSTGDMLRVDGINWYNHKNELISYQDILDINYTGIFSNEAIIDFRGETCNILSSPIPVINLNRNNLLVIPQVGSYNCATRTSEIKLICENLELPYSVFWNGNEVNQFRFDNLIADSTYTYRVVNNNGCETYDSITINYNDTVCDLCESTQVEVTGYNIRCFAEQNGQAHAYISSELTVLNAYWEGPENYYSTGNRIYGLTDGDYSYNVTLINEETGEICRKPDNTVAIHRPGPINISFAVRPTLNCDSTGSIKVFPSGGAGNYSYRWNHSVNLNTNEVGGLGISPVSNYIVTVTDRNNCSISENILMYPTADTCISICDTCITEEDICDRVNFEVTVYPSFCEHENGKVEVISLEGIDNAEFTLLDYNRNQTLYVFEDSKFEGVDTGKYYVNMYALIDTFVCEKQIDVDIYSKELPSVRVFSDISNSFQCNSFTVALPEHNFVPLEFTWNDSISAQSLYTNGDYSLKVSSPELSGCVDYYYGSIINNCNNDTTITDTTLTYFINLEKEIKRTCTNGNPEYYFEVFSRNVTINSIKWYANGDLIAQRTTMITAETPGLYEAFISATINGEDVELYFENTIYAPINYNYILIEDLYDCSKPIIKEHEIQLISNDPKPYDIYWTINDENADAFVNENSITVDSLDNTVTAFVNDFYGCEHVVTEEVTFDDSECLCSELEYEININPISCWNTNDGKLELMVNEEDSIIAQTWRYGGTSIGQTDSLNIGGEYKLSALIYHDSVECLINSNAYLPKPEPISVTNLSITEPSCSGMNDGAITLSTTGGTGNIQYYENALPINLLALNSGTHDIELIDNNNCSIIITDSIPESRITCDPDFRWTLNAKDEFCADPVLENVYLRLSFWDRNGSSIEIDSVRWYSEIDTISLSTSNELTSELIAEDIYKQQNYVYCPAGADTIDCDSLSYLTQRATCKCVCEFNNTRKKWFYLCRMFYTDSIGQTQEIQERFYVKGGSNDIQLNPTIVSSEDSASTGSIILNPQSSITSSFNYFSIERAGEGVNYAAETGEAFGLSSGTYYLAARDVRGCFGYDTVVVSNVFGSTCDSFDITITQIHPSNIDLQSGELHASVKDPVNFPGPYRFNWVSTSQLQYGGVQAQSISNIHTGWFTVTVVDSSTNCALTRNVYLEDTILIQNINEYPQDTLCGLEIDVLDFFENKADSTEIRNNCHYYWDLEHDLGPQPKLPLGSYDLFIGCYYDNPDSIPTPLINMFINADEFSSSDQEIMENQLVRVGNTIFWENEVVVGDEYLRSDIMSNDTICNGESLYLVAGGTGTFNWYAYQGDHGLPTREELSEKEPISSEIEPLVTPSNTTTYVLDYIPDPTLIAEVFGSDISKIEECSALSKVTIEVDRIEVDENINYDYIVCEGDNFNYEALPFYSSESTLSFSWDDHQDFEPDTSDFQGTDEEREEHYQQIKELILSRSFINTTPVNSTNYNYTVISDNGCSIDQTLNITVDQLPEVSSDDTVIVCDGETYQLSVTGGVSYNWEPGTNLSSPVSASPLFTGTDTTEYVVTISNNNGCSTEKTILVCVLSPFEPVIEIDESACLEGQNIRLTGNSEYTYQWSQTGFNLEQSSNNTAVYNSSLTSIVYVTVTNQNNCSNVVEVSLDERQLLDIDSVPTICFGQSIELVAYNGNNITWEPNVSMIGFNVNNPIVQPIDTITYIARGFDIFGCEVNDEVTVDVDPTCECYSTDPTMPSQKTYFWRAALNPHSPNQDWYNPENWSLNSDEYIPATTPPSSVDNVVIGDIIYGISNFDEAVFSGSTVIHNICILGGGLLIEENSVLEAQNNGIFTGGVVSSGETPGTLRVDGLNYSKYNKAIFAGTEFSSLLYVENTEDIFLNGSVFNDYTYLSRDGESDIMSSGGNIYNSETTISNNGTGELIFSLYPDGSNDIYNGNITFISTHAPMHVASRYQDEFSSNITLSGNLVDFGYQGGSVLIHGENMQSISLVNEEEVTPIVINKLIVDKQISSTESGLMLLTNVVIPSSSIMNDTNFIDLRRGIITTFEDSYLSIERFAITKGGSVESFVNGPMKVVREGDIHFPVGKIDRYMPVSLLNSAGSELGYISEFIEDNPLFVVEDSIASKSSDIRYLSECEYWSVQGVYDAGLRPRLSWDTRTCDVTSDLSKLLVTTYNPADNNWSNIGNSSYTGSQNAGGTVTSNFAPDNIFAFALGSEIQPGLESPTGFSFNVYGAKVNVNDSMKLVVYGNLHNENEVNNNTTNEDPGLIYNYGSVLVEKDWTNNSDDFVFENTGDGGIVELFGANQRLRGTSKTVFHKLYAEGNGRKSMYQHIDVDSLGLLELNNNEVATREYTLYVKNSDNSSISRGLIGFVSSRDSGYLAWNISESYIDSSYFYPLGVQRKFRPICLKPVVMEDDLIENYSARFANSTPNSDGYNVQNRSPFIEKINPEYYHLLRQNQFIPSFISNTNSEIDITFFYDKSTEDYYQSVSNWNDSLLPIIENPITGNIDTIIPENYVGSAQAYHSDTTLKIWNTLMNIESIYADSINMQQHIQEYGNTPVDRVIVHSLDTFYSEPYALARKGFIMYTEGYGDPDENGSGVAYSLSGNSLEQGAPTYYTNIQSNDGISLGVNSGNVLAPDILGNSTAQISFYETSENIPAIIRFRLDGDAVIDTADDYIVKYVIQTQNSLGQIVDVEYDLDTNLYEIIQVPGQGSIVALKENRPVDTCGYNCEILFENTYFTIQNCNEYTVTSVIAIPFDNTDVSSPWDISNAITLTEVSGQYQYPSSTIQLFKLVITMQDVDGNEKVLEGQLLTE